MMDYRQNIGMTPVYDGASCACGAKEFLWEIKLENGAKLVLCDVCLSEIMRHHRMWRRKVYAQRKHVWDTP